MASFVPTAGFDAVELLEDSDAIQGRVAGDSVATGSLENANKHAAMLLNNIEALKIGRVAGPRNCMLSGPDGYAYGVQTGTFGEILTITGPILFSFANGFSDFGATDVVQLWDPTPVQFDYTGVDGIYLIFAERSSGGVIAINHYLSDTVGSIKYHVGENAPSFLGATQFWFDTSRNQMYKEVGGAWVATMAVFLGGMQAEDSLFTFTFLPRRYAWDNGQKECPIGSIVTVFSGATMPYGWLPCDGSVTSTRRGNYIELFNVIGSNGGAGRYFNIPNYSGSVLGTGAGQPVDYYIKAF